MQMITNNQPRDILCWYELTAKERGEFDYIDSNEAQECAQFVRYRGWIYDLGEFMRCPDTFEFKGWHGSHCDSYFSAIVLKYTRDFEQVIMGRAYS